MLCLSLQGRGFWSYTSLKWLGLRPKTLTSKYETKRLGTIESPCGHLNQGKEKVLGRTPP